MCKKYLLFPALLAFVIPLNAQIKIAADRLEKHVTILAADSLLGRGFGTQQGLSAAHYIAGQFKEAGIDPLNGSYFHPFNYRTGILNIAGVNVAGIIPGNDPVLRDEYIVLGAHYDHLGWEVSAGDTVIFNGADDNASGTASIIEIGRNLARQRKLLGRSVIIVAFDGEESGLIGSNRFLKDSIVDPRKIRLMFSLDMVGMYGAHGGVDLTGVKLLTDYEALIDTLAVTYGVTVTKANRSIGQRTDTAPFGKLRIPAIHVFTGEESPYHKPQDEADLLDYEGMAKLNGYLSDATIQLSSAAQISSKQGFPEGGSPLAGTRVFQPGIRIGLGSSHYDYREQYYEGKPVFSGEAGVMATIRPTRMIAFQPEVLYETKGSQFTGGNFRTHSITTPLNLLFISPANEYMQTYFLFGAYYSYHFKGSQGDTPLDFQDEYAPHEFGINYGFGFQVMNVQLGICIRKGLSSLLQDPDPAGGSILHEGVTFSLGYLF